MLNRNSRLCIVVMGYVVRGPLGGMAWMTLQYLRGFTELGHEVYYLEDSDDYPSCYDPIRQCTDRDPTHGLEFARAAFERLGLTDQWAYYDAHSSHWLGPRSSRMLDICRRADVVISLNYINPLRPWTCGIPKRVLIDGDPVFSQIRNLTKPKDYEYSNGHNHFFTFAENYGKKEVTVPKDGFPWRPTRQPICLSAWPATPGREDAKFTSIMNWDSFPQYEYNGVTYGMKSHSFQEYIELPKSTGSLFELALGGANAPRDLLREKGWFILSPEKLLDVTRDPWTYQTYIQQSKGEFCINKQAFVVTQSGWFSEKSAAYLASGRPVLSLDTGYPSVLPTGAGLFAFSSVNDVQAGLAAINADYKYHCRKAREIAEEYFDAKKVLSKLLSDAGCG